jgi:ATPase subunit of ABC transporter with duplicated ATPase domains
MTTRADLILDAALTQAQQDRFDHEAIAGVVADLTLNATPPVDIALFGPWGSGKSTFFGLLNQRISESDQSVKVARYDTSKYGGRALKKHFVGSVASNSVSAATSSSTAPRTTCSAKSSGAVPSREAGHARDDSRSRSAGYGRHRCSRHCGRLHRGRIR